MKKADTKKIEKFQKLIKVIIDNKDSIFSEKACKNLSNKANNIYLETIANLRIIEISKLLRESYSNYKVRKSCNISIIEEEILEKIKKGRISIDYLDKQIFLLKMFLNK